MRRALVMMMMLLSSCVAVAAVEPVMLLTGPIDELSVAPIYNNLSLVSSLPADSRPEVLVIEINSGGGEFDAGFVLAKAIENSPVPVLCVVDGEAASMAFYILQSCHIRAMTARSVLMWHGVSLAGMTSINVIDLPGIQNRLETLNKAACAHVSKRMKISRDDVAVKIARHDWWMAADEALAVGAVDTIVP